MTTDGRLARCLLKGTLGDALHAVLCGCGHNTRMILSHLRALLSEFLAIPMAIFGTTDAPKGPKSALRALPAWCSGPTS